MTFSDFSLYPALPEIVLLVAASIVLIIEASVPERRGSMTGRLALASLLAPTLATLYQMQSGERIVGFGGMYVADALAHVLKLCAYAAVAVTLVYSGGYNTARGMQRGEFQGLALFSLLGIMVMISANSLLIVYLGVELMILSQYSMVALRREHAASTEAAMKFFVLGALASGFMLYGMSMIYGATGTLDIPAIAQAVGSTASRTVLVFGLVFIVAGLAFEFGAVPFHMWTPDVYEGSPTSATLMIAAAPKLATFAISFRLLVEALGGLSVDWQQMVLLLALASLVLGNVVGVAQRNVKRLLAYSTISQVGFILLGLASGAVGDQPVQLSHDAYGSAMFYVVTYVLTTLAGFGVLALLARAGYESDRLDDLKGLGRRSPGLALVLLLAMLSLAGLPPTVGFYAKLAVLSSVVAAGHIWIAVAAVLLSVVGAFYYLRVIKLMYFDAPLQTEPAAGQAGARFMLGVNGAAVLLLGILPGPLMTLCVAAIQQALGT